MGLSPTDVVRKALASRERQVVADGSLTPAAVFIFLYPKDGDYCVLLNKRSQQVEHHKGEISFPGGAKDEEDRDFLETALREAQEEMGINPEDVKVLGQLDDFTTRSGFSIQVYVGTIDDFEIAEVLEVPLNVLRSPSSIRMETRWEDGQYVDVCSYAYNGHLIYGATARILQQFLSVLEEGPAE